MTRRSTVAVLASVALASLGATTTLAFGDPPVTGAPATIYVTATVTTASLYHGHSAGFLAMRLRQTRVHLRASVLQRLSLARKLRNETRAARAAARDYRDDFGIQSDPLARNFLCVHGGEGSWTDPGSPFWGGLQMDEAFMRSYGSEFLSAYGTADRWPPFVQLAVAMRAKLSGRGFYPWPNTARKCGLL